MNFNDLAIFVDIYETGSLNQSAMHLGYAQSNLTARLKKLELDMETRLFIRRYNGLTPTKNGDQFYLFAKEAIQNLAAIKERFNADMKKILISELLLNDDINNLQTIDITKDTITIKKTRDIASASLKNSFDRIISFLRLKHVSDMAETRKTIDSYYLASPLIDDAQCAYCFVNRDETCPFRQQTLAEFAKDKVVIELDSFENIITCIESGQGIALLPGYLTETKKLQKWEETSRPITYYSYE